MTVELYLCLVHNDPPHAHTEMLEEITKQESMEHGYGLGGEDYWFEFLTMKEAEKAADAIILWTNRVDLQRGALMVRVMEEDDDF